MNGERAMHPRKSLRFRTYHCTRKTCYDDVAYEREREQCERDGRTIWIVDAHRDGKRFIVRADEKLTAFVKLETAIQACYKSA